MITELFYKRFHIICLFEEARWIFKWAMLSVKLTTAFSTGLNSWDGRRVSMEFRPSFLVRKQIHRKKGNFQC